MTTAGYKPAFVLLGVQFAIPQTEKAVAASPDLPPVYAETSWWPLGLASQNPSTEELVKTMHTYAKGDSVDFDDEEGAEGWLLWAKAASACGTDLTVNCVLNKAAAVKNWDAGGIEAPIAQLDALERQPPALAVLRHLEDRSQGDRLGQVAHRPHAVHLELQPQERHPPDRGAAAGDQQLVNIGSASSREPESSRLRWPTRP